MNQKQQQTLARAVARRCAGGHRTAALPRQGLALLASSGFAACMMAGHAMADDVLRGPIEYPQKSGVQIGQGWNSQTVQSKDANCITQFHVIPNTSQTVTAQMKMVTDQSTLSDALSIGADAQVSSIAGYSAGVKMEFAKSQKIDSSFLSVAQLVQVDNGWSYAAPVPAEQQAAVAKAMRGKPSMQGSARTPTSAEVALQLKVPVEPTQKAHARFFDIVNQARTPAERTRAKMLALAYIDYAHAAGLPLDRAPKPTSLNSPAPPPLPKNRLAKPPRASGPQQAATPSDTPTGEIVLTDYYAKLSGTNPDEFLKRCGDSFVYSVNQGGELAIRYTFMTRSSDEQQSISAAVTGSASAGGNTVSVSADFKTSTAAYKSSGQLMLDSAIVGGSGLAPAKDLDGINALVSGFPAAAQANPANFSITVKDYSTLSNYGGSNKMAPLTNLEKLAWEFGKADSLLTTTLAMTADIDKQAGGQDGSYVLTRWGGKRSGAGGLEELKGTLSARRDNLKSQAQQCLAAKDPNSNVCLPSNPAQMDDLSPRTNFPLPLQAGRAADMLNAVYGDNATYQGLAYDYWIARPNTQRCAANRDSLFCRRDDLSGLTAYIRALDPAVATLSVQGQNNLCWNALNDSGRMFMQPCPLNASSVQSNSLFAYEKKPNGYYHLTTIVPDVGKQCVSALRDDTNDIWVAAVACDTPRAGARAIGQEWALSPSLDGQSFQVVSTNASFINQCVFIWTDGNSTGLSNCGNGTRFRIGQAYAANRASGSMAKK